ncbi:MAG: MBL fold metallo-hydrolase [Leptospiraceae bacterium]|nr:MBL fold metallo-hydrolase [Leptospiraceae bacterium]
MSDIQVTFRGVRGSHAMPGAGTIRYGGNTTCLEVRAGDLCVVMDAGTGIISLGKELIRDSFQNKQPVRLTLLLTHMHHDHNEGLPFFQPMYVASSRIYMFGPDPLEDNISTVLFQSPYFPVELQELPALKFLHSVVISDAIVFDEGVPRLINTARSDHKFNEEEVYIRIHRGKAHPKEGVFMYRLHYRGKSISFCTDTEGYIGGDSRLIEFVRDTDLLIHDAMYTEDMYVGGPVPRQGFGHSTPEMAIEVARRANVKQLACTHHDPDSDDDQLDKTEKEVRAAFKNSFFTREGMTVEV